MAVVRYKASESRDSQILRHTTLNEALSQNLKDWQEDGRLFNKNSLYSDDLVYTLHEIQTICYSNLSHINVAKHHIEFLITTGNQWTRRCIVQDQTKGLKSHNCRNDQTDSHTTSADIVCFIHILSTKRIGTLRFLVDYWRRNVLTKRESYAVPR